MERSDALAIVVTAVDRSCCVLFRPAAENYGDKYDLIISMMQHQILETLHHH